MVIVLLSAVAALTPEAPLLLWRTFDPFEEAAPMTREQAMMRARPEPRLSKYAGQIQALFHPSASASVNGSRGIRLAVRLRGRWLYVDYEGGAFYGKKGGFDADGWERLISRNLKFLPNSQRLRFSIRNETSRSLRYSNLVGEPKGVLPARKTVAMDTLFWTYEFFHGKAKIGEVSLLFGKTETLSKNVIMSFARLDSGALESNNKPSPAARLIIQDSQ